jgi:hypothetical protein
MFSHSLHEDNRCWWFVTERGMRADGAVVTAPAFDDDLSFQQRVEDLAVEQFVTQAHLKTFDSRSPTGCLARCSRY